MKFVEASKGVELIANTHDHDHEHEAVEHNHENHNNNEATEHEHEHEHDHGAYDPHVWLSPIRAIKELENITMALSGS